MGTTQTTPGKIDAKPHRRVNVVPVLEGLIGGVRSGVVLTAVLSIVLASPGMAQRPDSVIAERRAKGGSEFWIPLGSLFVPGLGQYIHGAPLMGAGYSASAVAGVLVGETAGTEVLNVQDLPRDGADQLAYEGYHVASTAGLLSAWDAFQRSVPAMQAEGNYRFLTERDDAGGLVSAPFDVRFLSRWTTWVHLAYTGLVAGLVLGERERSALYEPFRFRDAAFVAALSFNAGVGEEAAFRGWLFPMFHQLTGERFWLGNALQAGLFGGAHVPQADEFALVITAWALYEGWLTRRNGWSIRESIFHHFWYDVIIATATLVTDERPGTLNLAFPPIRF